MCWDLLAHPDPSKALVPQPPPHCRQAAGSLFYEHAKSIRNHKTTLGCRQPIAKEAKARDVAWSSSRGGAHQEVYPLGSRGGYLLFLCQAMLIPISMDREHLLSPGGDLRMGRWVVVDIAQEVNT